MKFTKYFVWITNTQNGANLQLNLRESSLWCQTWDVIWRKASAFNSRQLSSRQFILTCLRLSPLILNLGTGSTSFVMQRASIPQQLKAKSLHQSKIRFQGLPQIWTPPPCTDIVNSENSLHSFMIYVHLKGIWNTKKSSRVKQDNVYVIGIWSTQKL